MPMQTNTRLNGRPNKSAFVRGLAFNLPAAAQSARANATGMQFTRQQKPNHAHATRVIARHNPMRQSNKSRPTTSAARAKKSSVNKSAFVRSLPGTLSAAAVIARGKTKGIRLSAAQVYTIRANARRKDEPKTNGRGARAKSATAVRSINLGRGADAREAEFIAAALDLGLTKAEALIAALRSKVVSSVS
jgi:hypothetical protein